MLAPVAVIFVELPKQMVEETADAVTVGIGFTVTKEVAVPVQDPVVPVTV